jgi:hypothetical protein
MFYNLDDSASKPKLLLLKPNYIIGFVGAVALVTIGYLVYQKLLSQNN